MSEFIGSLGLFFVSLLIGLFTGILLLFVDLRNGSPYISNGNLIFPGWLLLATITTVIVWPLAYAIRSIPGFSQVLSTISVSVSMPFHPISSLGRSIKE